METLLKYFKHLNAQQIEQFSQLMDLYRDWNEKINLISRKDIDHLYEKHVLHSLAIAKIIQFQPGTEILDIGTGGGFPGIPLAIFFPNCTFDLIDSIGKKIKVVQDISNQLKLKNVNANNQHSNNIKKKYDFIVSRAVTALPEFIKLAEGKIKPVHKNGHKNGILYLKGGDLSQEIKGFEKKLSLYPISGIFDEEFFKTKFVLHYSM